MVDCRGLSMLKCIFSECEFKCPRSLLPISRGSPLLLMTEWEIIWGLRYWFGDADAGLPLIVRVSMTGLPETILENLQGYRRLFYPSFVVREHCSPSDLSTTRTLCQLVRMDWRDSIDYCHTQDLPGQNDGLSEVYV